MEYQPKLMNQVRKMLSLSVKIKLQKTIVSVKLKVETINRKATSESGFCRLNDL